MTLGKIIDTMCRSDRGGDMKRILVLAALALSLAGCANGAGGRPDVPAAAASPIAPSPTLSISPDKRACDAARALDTAGATADDYAALAVTVSKARDDRLAEAGIALARDAAGGFGTRSSLYARYLDVMAQCQRFPA